MSSTQQIIFKPWVPEHLVRFSIAIVLLQAVALFAFYFSNSIDMIGYYGIEPTDVQFSMVLMYGGIVCVLPLGDRFVRYFKMQHYLLIGFSISILTALLCSNTRDLSILFVCRFLQGAACGIFSNICLNLIIPRLHSTRTRIITNTIFYGSTIVSVPVCAVICNWILSYYSFDAVYYALVFAQIPGVLLLIGLTYNVTITKKIPLYQIEWVSYIYYAIIICGIGYMLVYGQQLNWFDNTELRWLLLLIIGCITLFTLRQFSLKRPFINLRIFSYKAFRNGILLLAIFYFYKGTASFATNYLQGALGVTAVNLNPIYISTFIGAMLGLLVTSRFLLRNTDMKRIILIGFCLLLVFHIQVYFLFANSATIEDFLFPFFIQGLSVSVLLIPLIIYTAMTIPAKLTTSVSFLGIAFRFLSFTITMAITNYFQLVNKSNHYNRFADSLTELNPMVNQSITALQQSSTLDGKNLATVKPLVTQLFNKAIGQQVALRASLDYYTWVIYSLLLLITLLIIFSPTKRLVAKITKRFIPY